MFVKTKFSVQPYFHLVEMAKTLKSIEQIYGKGFDSGFELGVREITNDTMKDSELVQSIIDIGSFWEIDRESRIGLGPRDPGGYTQKYPKETKSPSWEECKDHRRFVWGFTQGRMKQVLFNQGKISEDELWDTDFVAYELWDTNLVG